MRAIVCSAIVLVTGTGCANVANYTSVYRRPDLNDGRSLVLDNEQSAILVIRGDRNGDGTPDLVACAQPAPDAITAEGASASLMAEIFGEGEGQASGSAGESAASLGLRTQSIQLLRDAFYRMCEGYANGGIDGYEYGILTRRFQSNMLAILAIEQLTGAVTGPAVAVSVGGSADASRGGDTPATTNADTSPAALSSGTAPAGLDPQAAAAVSAAVTRITLNAINQDFLPQMCIELLRLNNARRAELDALCEAYLAEYMAASIERLTLLDQVFLAVATDPDIPAGERALLLARIADARMDSAPVASVVSPVSGLEGDRPD